MIAFLQIVPALLGAALCGFFLYRLCIPFVSLRPHLFHKVLFCLTFTGTSGMVIWIGDPNLLYTLPVFFALFLFCTRGLLSGRLSMATIFFCLIMAVSALSDSYISSWNSEYYTAFARLFRLVVFSTLYLLLRRRLPGESITLSPKLWRLVLALSAMPLSSLMAAVLLTYRPYSTPEIHSLSWKLGLVILPFTFFTAVVLLAAITVLAHHEALEQREQLASLREVYYQGLQQQDMEVRRLRHDLRNHLTVLYALSEQGDTSRSMAYLNQLMGSPALHGAKRLCENETANAVLCVKAEALRRSGGEADFSAQLPRELPLPAPDLCALLGNAIDNAMEAVAHTDDKRVILRCRADKGLFMLRVDNAVSGPVLPNFSTTKADKRAHGFGLPGMEEIARRYGGSVQAGVRNGRFELIVCLPLREETKDPSCSAGH